MTEVARARIGGDMNDHPFARLSGTWRGGGEGSYPTIAPFAYREELVVEATPGRPIAQWRSRTRDAETGEPRHAELGFLRSIGDDVELAVAHGFGIVETAVGRWRGTSLVLTSEGLLGTPSAKEVAEVERRYDLDGDVLRYTVSMAAVGVPLTHHLRGELHRDDESTTH